MSPRRFLARFGFDVARIELLKRGPSALYRFEARDRARFLLRLRGPADAMTPAVARVQQQWLDAVANSEAIGPEVVPLDGEPFQNLDNCQAAVFTWVPGRRLGGPELFVKPARLAGVAEVAAILHVQARTFRPPGMSACRRYDADYFFDAPRDGLSRLDRALLDDFARRTRRAMGQLGERPARFGMIHADLEPQNWVFFSTHPRPIDFERFGVGYYLFDLAQILWTHSMWPGHDDYRRVLLAAYESIRPLDDVERRHVRLFDALPLLDWVNRAIRNDDGAALRQWLRPTMQRIGTLIADRS